MRRHQNGGHQGRIAEVRQRGDAQNEGQNERADAIGADPAVTHDLELALARRAAAEAVGDVGQSVLVQGAGNGHGGRNRKRRGGQRRQMQALRNPIDAGADQPDRGADNRRGPERLRQLAFRDRLLKGQAAGASGR